MRGDKKSYPKRSSMQTKVKVENYSPAFPKSEVAALNRWNKANQKTGQSNKITGQ